jgi:hypothetical protein
MMKSIIRAVLAAALVLSAGLAAPGRDSCAAVYYVDPVGGDDAGPGLAQDRAWQHLPGSYRNDNRGYIAAPGWTKIEAGDVIKIKSGSTITNKLLVGPDWYANGTPSAPIRITRDPEWGSGPVTFDGCSQALARYDPMFFVWRRDYVIVDGATPAGFCIQNSRSRGFQATGASEAVKMAGLVVKNMKVFNSIEFNVNVQRSDNFLFEDVEIDGNRQNGSFSGGFMIGDNTYGCSNGRVIGCRSYNNGDVPGTSAGGTNTWIGFWVTNSTGITFKRCSAHHNKGNGFDAGVVSDPPSVVTDMIKYIDCEAHDNSNGFSCNLDDIGGTARFWYINCIARANGAGWTIYQGPSACVYNCLTALNTWGIYIDAPPFRNRQTVVDIKNTIFYRNDRANPNTSHPWDLWTHQTASLVLASDYNLFEERRAPGRAPQATCIGWNGAEVSDAYRYDAASAPGSRTRTWHKNHGQDAHSLCSVDGRRARFASAASKDYRPTARSSLIGKGLPIDDPLIPEIYRDRDGRTRPASDPWDIGPYAYAPRRR